MQRIVNRSHSQDDDLGSGGVLACSHWDMSRRKQGQTITTEELRNGGANEYMFQIVSKPQGW